MPRKRQAIDDSELRRLYHAEGLTLAKVGARLGISLAQVHFYMVELSIERRKPGGGADRERLRAGQARYMAQPGARERKANILRETTRKRTEQNRKVFASRSCLVCSLPRLEFKSNGASLGCCSRCCHLLRETGDVELAQLRLAINELRRAIKNGAANDGYPSSTVGNHGYDPRA